MKVILLKDIDNLGRKMRQKMFLLVLPEIFLSPRD